MTQLKQYHRPQTVPEALELLADPAAAVLAGGTRLVPQVGEWEKVVDLQAIGLNQIEMAGQSVRVGAMVRLQTLVDHPTLPPLIREMARREGANTMRNTATLGGTIATADPESELYAALLVHEAEVTWATAAGRRTTPLADFKLTAGGLILEVTMAAGGKTASARVGRTPADKPIVAVAGRSSDGDPRGTPLIAICGIAARPRLVSAVEAADLDPPADFRGSSAYRKQMALTLMRRVLNELQGGN